MNKLSKAILVCFVSLFCISINSFSSENLKAELINRCGEAHLKKLVHDVYVFDLEVILSEGQNEQMSAVELELDSAKTEEERMLAMQKLKELNNQYEQEMKDVRSKVVSIDKVERKDFTKWISSEEFSDLFLVRDESSLWTSAFIGIKKTNAHCVAIF